MISTPPDIYALQIEVDPGQFLSTDFADVTIKAVDQNGDIVTDYDGDVALQVDSYPQSDPNIILPSSGLVDFDPVDQ